MIKRSVWPNGKQSAAMVTVEIDNEFIWLGMDSDSIGRPKVLSNGEYGLNCGLDRILYALNQRSIKATFFILGAVAKKYPYAIKQVVNEGHEIALHGYFHKDYMTLTAEEQKWDMQRGMETVAKVSGYKPLGFRAPEGCVTKDTLCLIRDMDFLYDSSLLGNDVPYYMPIDGKDTSVVEIPMHWELQDFPYFAFNRNPPYPFGLDGISGYNDVLYNWLVELEAFNNYGLCYVCKFDPQTIGSPGKMYIFNKLLDDMLQKNIWIATGKEIAEYFKSNPDAMV